MEIKLEKIVSDEALKKFSKADIKSINESINKSLGKLFEEELNKKTNEIEQNMSGKFNSLVEGITKKFDDQVNNSIVENFKNNAVDNVNKKFYTILKDMVNLLENAGFPATEKTKELQEKLTDANDSLEKAWSERETIKGQLTSAEKENYILSQLKGMNPQIINSALEFFKNKDILDVQDELQTFLDGDFSNLDLSADEMDGELAGTVDLNKVKDALEEIDTTKKDYNFNTELNKEKAGKFESLGKGLKQQKVLKSKDISNDELKKSESIVESVEEEDTKDALKQIKDFNSLGYNFN